MRYSRKVYFQPPAATEGAALHIWPPSCPFINALMETKGAGSARNGGAGEERWPRRRVLRVPRRLPAGGSQTAIKHIDLSASCMTKVIMANRKKEDNNNKLAKLAIVVNSSVSPSTYTIRVFIHSVRLVALFTSARLFFFRSCTKSANQRWFINK